MERKGREERRGEVKKGGWGEMGEEGVGSMDRLKVGITTSR